MRAKGRYVATVIMDFDYEENQSVRPFGEIKNAVVGGDLTNAIRDAIAESVFDENIGTLKVDQQYADLYEAEA